MPIVSYFINLINNVKKTIKIIGIPIVCECRFGKTAILQIEIHAIIFKGFVIFVMENDQN